MSRFLAISVFAFQASLSLPAQAGGGYFSGTKGARAAGRAGAATAKADDLSAAAHNPAGFAHNDGTLIQVGNRFSYNAYSYTRQPTLDWGHTVDGVPPYVEFQTVENQKPWQLLDPLLGISSDFDTQDWAFAFVAYAPAGVARQEFPVDGGQRYMMVSRNAQIVNYTANAAYRAHADFGVGLGLQWIYVAKLRYQLVIDGNQFDVNPVESPLDMLATVEGSDPFTFNAVLGAWYRPEPFLELAISAQVIPSKIETDSTLQVDPLSEGIDDDVELRREGTPADDVSLTLPLPLTARAAVRYIGLQGAHELFDVEFDVTYESWSRVERFTLDTNGLTANLLGQRLAIDRIEVAKHWRDTLSIQLGGDYHLLPDLFTLRGGVFYETAVAEKRYANVDFVGGTQLGGALGTSIFVNDVELALAYEYRHQPQVWVNEGSAGVYQEAPASLCEPPYTDPEHCDPRYLGLPSPPVNAGSYRAHSHIASVDVLYRF